ncbi:hypothetical protein [Sediminibacterium sp.]|uniref:hypothetical protein n=1 Tax=Sediminibacterium sp. TaxID=1917865 RepID=UPI003F6F5DB2
MVAESPNGLIYAQSQYLDALTDHWDALIINDYETIMPIPWKIKAGIKYAYTPPFIQQLGFIGAPINLKLESVIKRIYSTYRYGSILLNTGNSMAAKITRATAKSNLLLNLDQPFQTIKKLFRKDHLQNVSKALKAGLIYTEQISIDKAVLYYEAINGAKTPNINRVHYHKMIDYCNKTLQTNYPCFTRAVVNQEGDLLSTALFLRDNKRIYNIMNSTSNEGRIAESNHLLFHQIIQEFSEQQLILDFEGSSIPGIKHFYEGFGCSEEVYYLWHYNKLPFPLSIIP